MPYILSFSQHRAPPLLGERVGEKARLAVSVIVTHAHSVSAIVFWLFRTQSSDGKNYVHPVKALGEVDGGFPRWRKVAWGGR